MSKNRDTYTAGKKFALPLVVTAVTNLTSGPLLLQGAQVSPYLNKNRAESIWLSLLT